MGRHQEVEDRIDFTAIREPQGRAVVFFEALAYPGTHEAEAGSRFREALVSYFLWSARRQYGLKRVTEYDPQLHDRARWEGLLFRGGARIHRRLQSYRLWSKRGCWIEGDCNKIAPDIAATFNRQRLSIRAQLLRDLANAHASLRLDKHRGEVATEREELIRQLRVAVNDSKPVLHMAWQLDKARMRLAHLNDPPLPWAERRSWRNAYLRGAEWIDEAIDSAENWRVRQEPHRPNGLGTSEMIALVGLNKSGEVHPMK